MQQVFHKLPKYLPLVGILPCIGRFANMALMVALSLPYPSLVQVVPRVVWEWDDATWVMAASFIIFTMQTGCVGSDSERPTATALELIILVLIATSMND